MFFMVIDSRSDVYGNAVGRASLPYCPTPQKGKTDLNRAVPLCILLLFCAFLQEKRGYPTPENTILHPILHRKSSVNTGSFIVWCRKCRMFFQNFFQRERRDSGPGGKGCSINQFFIHLCEFSYAWPLFNLSLVSFYPLNTYIARYARVCRIEIYCAIA